MDTTVTEPLNPMDYYRLPWTLTDNVLGWLEPTKRCNLYCQGCYSRNDPKSDKSLSQIRADLEVFTRSRRMDSISIAGGDPLVHPEIVQIVHMVRHEFGLKPVVNTNGLALTPAMLKALRRAGVYGFTFHVDSCQNRPGWEGRDEVELNALRLQLAEMVAAEGGMSVAFNSTVFRHTLPFVPELAAWARDHIDLVHGMVFILFRTSRQAEFDYYANGQLVDTDELAYYGQDQNPEPVTTPEVVSLLRAGDPDYEPCAYLGGTQAPDSFKWLLAARIGRPGRTYGYVGRRFMETAQTVHHMIFNRYLGYMQPKMLAAGRSAALLASSVDPRCRRILTKYLGAGLRSPLELSRKLHFQSVLIIQPIDFMADGASNMCDGCPDMTVHQGQLVWSCRLDERMKHGCLLQAVPKCGSVAPAKRRLATLAPGPHSEEDELAARAS
jgi:hypothetical protein